MRRGQLALRRSAIAGSCSRRHSATLRAPTPAGSSDCTRRSAIASSSASGGGSSGTGAPTSSSGVRR